MAFTSFIPRAIRTAGIHRSAPRSVAAGVSQVALRLDSNWLGGSDIALFGVESSSDGGVTWKHVVSAATYGGARDRFGNLPTIYVLNPNSALLYRAFLLLSENIEMGLFIEVT